MAIPAHDLAGARRGTRSTSAPAGASELTEAVIDAIANDVLAAWVGEPRVLPSLSKCVHANVTNILDVVEGRVTLEGVDASAALEFASLAAEVDIPLTTVQRAYWVGVERFWNTWFDTARATAVSQADLTDRLSHVSQVLFAYVRVTLERVATRYRAIADDLPSRSDGRRRALATGLLAGIVEPTRDVEQRLGYRLDVAHVALRVESADAEELRSAITAVGRRAGARDTLVVHLVGTSWIAWMGFDGDPDAIDVVTIMDRARDAGIAAAVGEVAVGVEGFRSTAQQAQDTAAMLAGRTGSHGGAVVRYADVRLDVLLDQAPRIDQFVRDELGTLDDDSERSVRIRETLLVWLSTGSQAQTALQLGVHENTVRLRIRTATDLLGDAINTRRTELLVALRVRALRDGKASGGAAVTT